MWRTPCHATNVCIQGRRGTPPTPTPPPPYPPSPPGTPIPWEAKQVWHLTGTFCDIGHWMMSRAPCKLSWVTDAKSLIYCIQVWSIISAICHCRKLLKLHACILLHRLVRINIENLCALKLVHFSEFSFEQISRLVQTDGLDWILHVHKRKSTMLYCDSMNLIWFNEGSQKAVVVWKFQHSVLPINSDVRPLCYYLPW